MNIVWIILLLVGLIIAWFLWRSYYKDSSSRAISFILLVLVAFFAAWLALKYSHDMLWDIKPHKSLWTGFILSSIIAFISLLLWNNEASASIGWERWCGKAWCACATWWVCWSMSTAGIVWGEKKWCGKAGCGCANGWACSCEWWTCNTWATCTDWSCDVSDTSKREENKKSIEKKSESSPSVAAAWAAGSVVPVYSGKPDDLKIIEGIGPVIEWFLNEHGIVSFKQIGDMTPEQVKSVLDRAGERFKTHTTESRPLQARFAWAWRMKELKAMKDELDGGKFIPGGKYTKDSA